MEEKPLKQIAGAIYPIQGSTKFDRETWCQFISGRKEFRSRPPRQAPNPFKPGEMMTLPTFADAAEVIQDGRPVGQVYWSMSEEPLVCVFVEPLAMPLVQEWAAAMGGIFREERWED